MYKVKNFFGEEVEVELAILEYQKPKGRIALQLYDDDGPYATLSVNLPDERCGENEFFVDANNCPWAEDFLVRNGIAEPTNNYGFSGWCMYPQYRLVKGKE